MEKVTESIRNIGVYDKDIELFENQYIIKNGMRYNSYIIEDEKIAILDSVDKRKCKEWLDNIENVLNGKKPDYIVVSHLEPDHSGSLESFIIKYPEVQVISNEKVFSMLPQFIETDVTSRKIVVKEQDEISLGKHKLKFFMTPMVHWPEVMFSYEMTEKILFSADAFGTFGESGLLDEWKEEARRYFINIVGKYGMQVQNVLKKLNGIDIDKICALHGPVLENSLEYYINLYDIWSKYEPEENGILIVCGSLHGNTYEVGKLVASKLKECGEKVELVDISREAAPDIVSKAFKYSKMCIACSTYNMSIFPAMNSFLHLLKEKNYQGRKVGIIENGSWAPNAANVIKEILSKMKNIEIVEPIVTVKTKLSEETEKDLLKLIEVLKK